MRLQGFVWRTCREIVFFSQCQMSYRSDLRRERVKELTARRAKRAPSGRGIYDYILSMPHCTVQITSKVMRRVRKRCRTWLSRQFGYRIAEYILL